MTIIERVTSGAPVVAAVNLTGAYAADPRADRLNGLMKRWREQLSKRKGLMSSVSILPLAACGGGTEQKVLVITADTDISARTDLAGYILDLQNLDGIDLTMTAEQHNSLGLRNTGNGQTITLTTAAPNGTTGFSGIEAYSLANVAGNDFTLGATGQDVTGAEVHGDVVRTGAVTDLTGTKLDLGDTGTDELLVTTTGTDLSGVNGGAATTAEKLTIDGIAAVSITDEQHNTFSTFAAAGTNTVTLTTVAKGNGIVGGTTTTGNAGVEAYVLANVDLNDFTIGATGQDVTGAAAHADIVRTGAVTNLTGTKLDLGDTGTDDLVVTTTGTDLSGVNGGAATTAEKLTIDGIAAVSMTDEQHNTFSTFAAAGTNTVTLTTVAKGNGIVGGTTTTGNAGVEAYVLANVDLNDFTIGATGQDVTGAAAHADIVRTGAVTNLTGTTLALGNIGTDELVVTTTGTNLSGVNGGDATTAEKLTIDGIAVVSMTDAQHDAFTSHSATGTNTITMTNAMSGTGLSEVEAYVLANLAGNDFTLGATGQDVTGAAGHADVVGTGAITDLTGTTLALGGTGNDELVVTTTGTNLSGINAGGITTAEILTINGIANVSMTVAQHEAFTTINASGTNTVTFTDAGAIVSETGIENYQLAEAGGSTFTQSATTTPVTVISGAGNDLIITNAFDANRSALTIDLTSGGVDTVRILNDTGSLNVGGWVNNDFGGFGGTETGFQYNDGTLLDTAADWRASPNLSQGSTTYVEIEGFTAVATDAGRDVIQLQRYTGGVIEDVNRTTTDLQGVASGSILEINTASFTNALDQVGNLQTVATMLDTLSNVGDGEYYIIVYDGSEVNANAALYYARATEGDGFDFADSNGATGGYDTDSLELLAVFHEVGANAFSSLNFQAVPIV